MIIQGMVNALEFDYDVAVIGGGPAGISAAINTALRGKSVAIFSNSYSDSTLYKAKKIDNYPGLPGISGAKLLEQMYEHLKAMDIMIVKTQVLSVAAMGEGFYLSAGSDVKATKAVILTTGVVQTAFFPGETNFLGHGVSYCATCDGMLYRGKKVAVIGQRSDAIEEANQLLDIGCSVTFISANMDTSKLKPGIDVMSGKKFEFRGDKKLSALIVDEKELEVDGVFIVRSSVAPDLLMPEISIKDGYVEISEKMETNIKGVFAAGDCTGKPYQISKAAGQGQVAAFSATAYIEEKNK